MTIMKDIHAADFHLYCSESHQSSTWSVQTQVDIYGWDVSIARRAFL